MQRLALDTAGTYFENHQDEIRGEFEAMLPSMHRRLADVHGKEVGRGVIAGARRHADRPLPKVPYIGGSADDLTRNLYQSAMVLALHEEMKARGRPARGTAGIVYRAFGDYPSELPQSLMLTAAGLAMGLGRPSGVSEQSTSFRYDGAYSDVPGDGKSFDYGVDYTQWGIRAYLREHDARDILPYLCLLGFPMYKAMGVELERAKTIARGDGVCDFRHNFAGRYHAEWEPFDLGL